MRCRSSFCPVNGRYRSLMIVEAEALSEPASVPIAAEKMAAMTSPSSPVGK